jgi:hypothetical protein
MLKRMNARTRVSVFAFVVACWLPSGAGAVICKTVDADGVVSYSEVPAAECPEAVKLPDYSRYAPRPIDETRFRGAEGSANQSATLFAGYTRMVITQPAANGTVRSNQGEVPVSIELEPGLQPGHKIGLTLDGSSVEGSFASTSLQIGSVERGTHTLRAKVTDEAGRVLILSPSVLFTLRQRGLFDGASEDVKPPVEPAPGFPGGGNADFDAPDTPPDYAPQAPNYRPGSGGIPTTPGRTNPAFAPNYRP